MNGKLKADLESIYEIARKDIMDIADQYSTLSNQLDSVEVDELNPSNAFVNGQYASRGFPDALRSGGVTKSLREAAQMMFAMSSINAEATASALIDAVSRYSENEDEIEAIFGEIENDIETSIPSEDNPPAFPPGSGAVGKL